MDCLIEESWLKWDQETRDKQKQYFKDLEEKESEN